MTKIIKLIPVFLYLCFAIPAHSLPHTFQLMGQVKTCIFHEDTLVLALVVDTNPEDIKGSIGESYYTIICPADSLIYCMYNSIGDYVFIEGVLVKQEDSLNLKQEVRFRASSIDIIVDLKLTHLGCGE